MHTTVYNIVLSILWLKPFIYMLQAMHTKSYHVKPPYAACGISLQIHYASIFSKLHSIWSRKRSFNYIVVIINTTKHQPVLDVLPKYKRMTTHSIAQHQPYLPFTYSLTFKTWILFPGIVFVFNPCCSPSAQMVKRWYEHDI